ncbi:MAG TPA: ABC transporter permease [Gaiellaceae bacterium]
MSSDVGGPRPRLLSRFSLSELSSSSQFLGVAVVLVAMFVAFSVTEPRFFTAANIRVMLTSVAILWMISLGLTVVMLTGGFDLSLGSMLGLAGFIFVGFYVRLGLPALLAVLLTVAAGALIGGATNGFLIGRVRMPFLVVTIGTLSLFQGITYLVSGGQTTSLTSSLLDSIGFGTALGVPYSVWIMLGTLAVSLFVLRRTYFGRDVYATGGNPKAAQLAGVSVTRTLIAAYAFAGATAALGGVLQNAFISAASPVGAGTIIFDATAAVLLGGTVLGGGVGGVGGTAIGVLFLGVLQNGLSLGGVQAAWQQVISGAIVISAVLFQQLQGTGMSLFPRRERPDDASAGSLGSVNPPEKKEEQV